MPAQLVAPQKPSAFNSLKHSSWGTKQPSTSLTRTVNALGGRDPRLLDTLGTATLPLTSYYCFENISEVRQPRLFHGEKATLMLRPRISLLDD
ncbi:hypothetical protein PILCRDRAFT_319707 [Piloderma croceum F 1598]|uniref:Uncharacterized protein n=1 Tax=Piloderma croceum (strain F 1598) TaxID=765440 RepID=A0A0C3C951_PILCF|nr:hypothetical protein PILCRDRAFT_319707 [Piloderma croceum F 1598]